MARCGTQADIPQLTGHGLRRSRLSTFSCVFHEREKAIDAVHRLAVGRAMNSAKTTPRWIASRYPIAGVARSNSSAKPVALVKNSVSKKATSVPRRGVSASAGSRRHFASNRPADPTMSPMPPSVPSTTGGRTKGMSPCGRAGSGRASPPRSRRSRAEIRRRSRDGNACVGRSDVRLH